MDSYAPQAAAGGCAAAPPPVAAPPPPVETPALGCVHPDGPDGGMFASPVAYMSWYRAYGALAGTAAPVAAVLLYRKHVITSQPYIPQLIRQMEAEGARASPPRPFATLPALRCSPSLSAAARSPRSLLPA